MLQAGPPESGTLNFTKASSLAFVLWDSLVCECMGMCLFLVLILSLYCFCLLVSCVSFCFILFYFIISYYFLMKIQMEGVLGGPGMIRERGHCNQDILYEKKTSLFNKGKQNTYYIPLLKQQFIVTFVNFLINITKYFPILHISHNKCENTSLQFII